MANIMHQSLPFYSTAWDWLMQAAKRFGLGTVILEDVYRQQYTYRTLLIRSGLIASWMRRHTAMAHPLGFLLPNMAVSVMTLVAGFASQRIWALLNYSAGIKSVLEACRTAEVKQVVTSRRFIEQAKFEALIAANAACQALPSNARHPAHVAPTAPPK